MAMTGNFWLVAGSIGGALGVMIGAFGAHGLKSKVTPEMLAIYETGVQYMMYHCLALLAVGMMAFKVEGSLIHWAGGAFLLGILLFSGSLFILVITGIKKLGMITPFGGTLMIAGWIMLAIVAARVDF